MIYKSKTAKQIYLVNSLKIETSIVIDTVNEQNNRSVNTNKKQNEKL